MPKPNAPDPRKRASLEEAERRAREIAHDLKRRMPEGWGFVLWLESFGPGGFATYLSSIERETALRSIKEWLARMESQDGTRRFVDATEPACWCCEAKTGGLVKVSGAHRSVTLCLECHDRIERIA